MSDLQCAATVVVVHDDADLEALRSERPAAVHAAPGAEDRATGLAGALEVPCRRLRDGVSGDLTAALDAVADEYRGECVVVAVTDAAFTALAALVLPGAARGVVVEIDADGRRWDRWPAVSGPRGR
ncbi:hypothetical protein [Georgenia sp. H159]|uniref:hypothetical protein n=1 Tax=Georgenia sp. H159 TaxID=3076115 RepID=UPI002D7866F9|nr:hypothetical protein [Georgenia sp. H159]